MLNPIVGEIMRNEALNLLDTDIIYPTSTREWAKEVRITPKEGNIVVVKNDNTSK